MDNRDQEETIEEETPGVLSAKSVDANGIKFTANPKKMTRN